MSNPIHKLVEPSTIAIPKVSFFWVSCLLLVILEGFVFQHFVVREIAPFYPNNFDQSGYLATSYGLYEDALKSGFFSTLKNGTLSTSFIFMPQVVLAYLLFGASRLTALMLNFLYFAVLQLFVVKTLWNITRKRSFAGIGLGLLLLVPTTFFLAGGITDFRIDFMGFCLYGIFITSILRSHVFLDRKWALISSVIGVYLILLRFIAVLYIAGVSTLLFGYFLIVWLCLTKQHRSTIAITTRLVNMIRFGVMLAVGTLPFLWINRALIYNYYVINHVLNDEKYIRAAQVGVHSLLTNLTFYPKSILVSHFGVATFVLAVCFIFTAGIVAFLQKTKSSKSQPEMLYHAFVLLFIAVLVPVTALTLDFSKSPVVACVTIVPVCLILVWTLYFIYQLSGEDRRVSQLMSAFAIILLILGTHHYFKITLHHSSESKKENLTQLTKMYLDIGDNMLSQGKHTTRYSTDQIIDYSAFPVLTALYYEKRQIYLPVTPKLSASFYDISEKEAISLLNESDVFIVNQKSYADFTGNYPFNLAMLRLRPRLEAVAAKQFVLLGTYPYQNALLHVYVRQR